MATIAIKIKRSNVVDKVPTISDIQVGELALNTADGKMYMRKSDDSIIAIGREVKLDSEFFEDGVDYTAGTSTTITLTGEPTDVNQIILTFNGLKQTPTEDFTLSGSTITIKDGGSTVVIPSGVTKIEAHYLV